MATNLTVKTEFIKGYSAGADEATGIRLTIQDSPYNESYRAQASLSLSEAGQLLRELANLLKEHRDALSAKHGASLEAVVNDLTASLPE